MVWGGWRGTWGWTHSSFQLVSFLCLLAVLAGEGEVTCPKCLGGSLDLLSEIVQQVAAIHLMGVGVCFYLSWAFGIWDLLSLLALG